LADVGDDLIEGVSGGGLHGPGGVERREHRGEKFSSRGFILHLHPSCSKSPHCFSFGLALILFFQGVA
jgi:hypothetical protein